VCRGSVAGGCRVCGGVAGAEPGPECGEEGLHTEDDVEVDVEVDGAGEGVGAEGLEISARRCSMVIRRAYCSIRAGIDVPAVGDDDGGRLAAHLGPPAADTAAARRLAGGLRPRRCSRSPWLDNTGGRSRVAGAPHPRQHANTLLRSAAGNALAAGRAVSRRADAIQAASAALREHRRPDPSGWKFDER
jgi:hypothetical protein